MGGHDHHHEIKIPDYTEFKIENCPKLLTVQKILAQKGLKDPWIRNEIWRFDETKWLSEKASLKKLVFRGFPYGFAAFVVTIVAGKLLSSGDEHGHGEHH